MSQSMVLMESGSRWPQWVDRQASGQVAMVVEHSGEPIHEFSRRIAERLTHAGNVPLTVTLVCNAQGGVERNRFREVVLRSVLCRLLDAGRGHVVLVADGDFSQRRILAELASRMCGEIGDTAAVFLRFRAQARSLSEAPIAQVA